MAAAPPAAPPVDAPAPAAPAAPAADAPSTPPHPYTFDARITFPTPADAATAAVALAVDPELRPALVTRSIAADGADLVIRVAAADARTLRASACTLCDVAGVAARATEAWPSQEKE